MRTLRILIALLSLAAVSVGVAHAGGGEHPEASNGSSFLHIVRNDGGPHDNTAAHVSALVSEYPRANTSPMTDANPNAAVFITHNMTFSTAHQGSPYGLMYVEQKWHVTNVDGLHYVGIGGQAFNVQVQSHGQNVFVHTANASNISSNYTVIDHPLLNGNSGALMNVTMSNGMANQHNIGVFYNVVSGRWAIYNENMAAMPENATFNIHVLKDSDVSFLHTASASNIKQTYKTEIDHPLLNDNIHAKLIVTHNWGAFDGIYNNNVVGVEYDNASKKWRIVNTNGAAMPEGIMFNVHIAGASYIGDGVFVNGGFEVRTNNSGKEAVKWNTSAAGAGSKRICNKYSPIVPVTKILSNTGECSFLLKGKVGETRRLSQNAPVSPNFEGGFLYAEMWGKAKNVTGLSVKVKVKMDDGKKVAFKLPDSDLNGTYDWKVISGSLLLPPTAKATNIIIKIVTKGGGKIYIDDVAAMFT